jgi:hypothetical protein
VNPFPPIFRRLLCLLAGAVISALAAGCMADPAEGDLPWAKPQTWEGTPALPPGMTQPR